MIKRFIKCFILAVVIATVLSLGIARYENDQDRIHGRISRVQRQQQLILRSDLPNLIYRTIQSVVLVEITDYGTGSGVIIAPNVVLTAGHVIRDASELWIETNDGKRYKATHWVRDLDNDCGLIFFDEELIPIAEFVDSNSLQLGESVFIIGSPFGKALFNTVTFGIVSGLNRKIHYFGDCGMITSDAAGNPGNSGGPVFDMSGKIIGIIVGTKRGSRGLNVIVPSNICRKLLSENCESTRDSIRTGDSG